MRYKTKSPDHPRQVPQTKNHDNTKEYMSYKNAINNSKLANKTRNLYSSNTQELNDKQAADTKKVDEKMSKMKVHRGPLNLNAITMRNPLNLVDEISSVVNKLGLHYKKFDHFSLKCEHKELKFIIEINYVEKFEDLYIIKFYKNNQTNNKYFELCCKIFTLINL